MVRDMRVFHDVPSEAWRQRGMDEEDFVCCAYDDCDGNLLDAIPWEKTPWAGEEPVRGRVYQE